MQGFSTINSFIIFITGVTLLITFILFNLFILNCIVTVIAFAKFCANCSSQNTLASAVYTHELGTSACDHQQNVIWHSRQCAPMRFQVVTVQNPTMLIWWWGVDVLIKGPSVDCSLVVCPLTVKNQTVFVRWFSSLLRSLQKSRQRTSLISEQSFSP